MTLALGILCDGGVVLGVDTQLTVDGGKFPSPKIDVLWESLPDYNLVFASCGHGDSIDTAIYEITEELERFKGRQPVVREIRRSIEEALARVYTRHIYPLPSIEERNLMDFTLLIAMRVGRVARLFRTNSAQVVEQKGRWCIGIGKEFADYAFDLLLENRPSTELAAQVAAYVIGITKEHIEGVGHATDVHVLEGNGRHWSLLAPEVQEVESSYSEFFKTLRMVIECTDSRFTSEESIPRRLDLLGDGIKDLRLAQDKRMDLRARMQEVLQRHQLTKADQSPPPPLPESPGGSNES